MNDCCKTKLPCVVKKIKLIFQVYFTPCVLQSSITGDKIFTSVDGESYVDNVLGTADVR